VIPSVKIEPSVVLENKPVDKHVAQFSPWHLAPGDSGFKQELVIRAVKAIGGQVSVNDVDSWIRKHHPQVYRTHFSRKAISKGLSRQADNGILCVQKNSADRRLNMYKLLNTKQSNSSANTGLPSNIVENVNDVPNANAPVNPSQLLQLVSIQKKSSARKSSKIVSKKVTSSPFVLFQNTKQSPFANVKDQSTRNLSESKTDHIMLDAEFEEPPSKNLRSVAKHSHLRIKKQKV